MLEHKVDKRSTVLGTPWFMAPELAIGAGAYGPNVSYDKGVSISISTSLKNLETNLLYFQG
jgi:serine/threonine protein kinase